MNERQQLFMVNLVAARRALGLSQTSLAGKAGFNPCAINHYEKGRRMPNMDNILKLADALEVTVGFLIGEGAK